MPMNEPFRYSFTGTLPGLAGIYVIVDKKNVPIYVGETDDFNRRMSEHRANLLHPMHFYGPVNVWIEYQADATIRRQRETALIAEYAPPANG